MQAKLLAWNYRDLLSIISMKKVKRNTKCEFGIKEIIDLSKICVDVMMSFNCQTEREPVVAQGPSVAPGGPRCLLLTASTESGWADCAPGVTPADATAPLPHKLTRKYRSHRYISPPCPPLRLAACHSAVSVSWSAVSWLLSEVTSPLTHCPHEPGTDYCQLTATHSWRPAGPGPAQAPGVQWAQGRGSIGLRRGVSCSHDSQPTVKAT